MQNQKKPSQFGKLNIFIRAKMTHKGEKYSIKMQKYYFCNGTENTTANVYNVYMRICTALDSDLLTWRRIVDLINEFDLLGLISVIVKHGADTDGKSKL